MAIGLLKKRLVMLTAGALLCASGSLYGCAGKAPKPTGQAIPEGFKIPLYTPSECTKADSTPLGDDKFSYVVVLKSPSDRFKIETYYKNEIVMAGYVLKNDAQNGEAIDMFALNDQYTLNINILTVSDQSIVSISWRPR